MDIPLPFDFNKNMRVFMRRAGYAEHNDPNTGKTSYTKRLSRDFYPRFHVYLGNNRDNKNLLSLHLDQKKPSYAGSHAHSAEYEGGQVEVEGNRLTGLVKNQMDNQTQENKEPESGPKGGFFKNLFK